MRQVAFVSILARRNMIKIAINGYGRIGRVAHRVIIEKFQDQIEVVAINAGSSTDIKGWMYLLQYDTVYGILQNHALFVQKPEEVAIKTSLPSIGAIVLDDKVIPFFSEKDPAKLPWKDLGVDVVKGRLNRLEREAE